MPSSLQKSLILLILPFLIISLSIAWAQETPPAAPPTTETAPAAEPAPPAEAAPPAAPPAAEAPAEAAPPETQPAPEAAPAKAEAPRLLEIEVVGNEKTSRTEIQGQIKSKVGEPYDEAQVEKDRVAIRDLGWFAHVQATATPVEGGVRLTFRVVENEIIKGVEIEGVTVPKPNRKQLLALLKTKPGEVANQNYVAQDIAAIEKAYADEGYVLAQVGGREITADGVLKLTVLEGKIIEIRVTGNKETKPYVVERELRSRPGQIYSARVMRKDLERIYNLGFFEDARAHPEVGTEPGTIILVVEVVEKKLTGLARFGGGWGSVGGFVGFVEASKDNWRGTGQRISLRGEFGGVKSYEAAYYNPWVASNHTSLNLSGYNRLTVREAFKSGGGSFLYDERRTGGGLTLGRPFGEYSRGFVTIRRDDLRIEDIRDDEAALEDVLFEPQSVRSISLGFVEDTRDIVASPTKGSRTSLVFESAGLVGGADFNKYSTDLRRYLSFGPRPKEEDIAALRHRKVLAFRLAGGVTTGDPPFLEQFLIGGVDTLRGYRPDRFPGKSFAILNSEFRFPLSDTLQGVLFADVGDAWGGSFAQEFGDTSFRSHVGYGVGIRVQSPLGPLRLDYGIGSEGAEIHFGMGQMF